MISFSVMSEAEPRSQILRTDLVSLTCGSRKSDMDGLRRTSLTRILSGFCVLTHRCHRQ